MPIFLVEGITHDDFRYGTATLFATLVDIANDTVVSNCGTHEHPEVRARLANRPRLHPHFTPACAFRLNPVGCWSDPANCTTYRWGSLWSAWYGERTREFDIRISCLDHRIIGCGMNERVESGSALTQIGGAMKRESRTGRIQRLFRVAIGVILPITLGGCITPSWVGRQIVHPPQSDAVRVLARAFYDRRVTLIVPPPDGGTINAAIIDPAPYNPVISIDYHKNRPGGTFSISFANLVGKCQRRCSPEGRTSVSEIATRLRLAVSRFVHPKPIGTVILLTGWGMGKSTLLPWALFFANWGWRTVLVDLRGQGDARARYLTWGIRDRADLSRLIRRLKRERLLATPWIYFGVSYGAGVALMASARATDPDGVIALAPWANAAKAIVRFSHSSFISGTFWNIFGLVPGSHSRVWPKAMRRAGKLAGIDLADATPEAWVGDIEAPVLYLGGTSDRIAPPASIQRLARRTPQAKVVIRPYLDHAAIFADVPDFCRPIVRWLSKRILPRPSHGICRIKTQIRKNRIHESLSLIAHKQEALAQPRL